MCNYKFVTLYSNLFSKMVRKIYQNCRIFISATKMVEGGAKRTSCSECGHIETIDMESLTFPDNGIGANAGES